MLTLEDCIALSELSEAEIAAIVEHDHVPPIVAAEIGRYLMTKPDGEECICAIIRDDIARAQACGNYAHSIQLKKAMRDFVRSHSGQN